MKLECMECGKKFTSHNPDTACPKCGSVDLELAEYTPPKNKAYRNYSVGPWDYAEVA